ncbi:MAG: hypothetical protein ABI833_11405 [Acidobacteriota bacterium]
MVPLNSTADVMRKAAEIRQINQQTELMRQQTEALRQQNSTPTLDPQTEPDANNATQGLLNGRGWLPMTLQERIYFLGAAHDMQQVYGDFGLHFGLTSQQLANAVEDFYINPANLPLPVIDALQIISLQRKGVAPPEVEQRLVEMRRKFQ